MAMVRKKQDDKYLEALRELITTGGGNRQCFDCGQKGPTYVNMTIGSFVCTRCSGVLRGLTPPHRVKSISMATFTQEEIDFLKAHGNDVCAKTWLGLWDPKRAVHQDQRELMIDKYERKRYFLEPASPLKSLTNATNLKSSTAGTGAASTTTSTSTSSVSSASNQNNRSSSNNNNNHTQIQLTPPTSQRTTANGLHKSSSSAISRPHHSTPQSQQQQQQNGFISNSSSNTHTDAFGLHNGLNTSVGSASTGALSDTSSCASANGFGAEADFVADFGSADIFNATVASSPASSIGSATTNGYAKIQSLKAAQFMNGGHGHTNGSNNNNNNNGFGSSPGSNVTNGNTENFADFDHAPIYNAAVEEANYQFVRKNAIRKKSLRSGSLTLKPNERQLKDILEMDNPLDDVQTQQQQDYMEFTSDNVYSLKQRNSIDFTNILEDFEKFLTFKQNEAKQQQQQQQQQYQQQQRQYQELQQRHHSLTAGFEESGQKKFTPLALAAHATAMAVLGNSNHFNTPLTGSSGTSNNNNSNSSMALDKTLNSQWDVWSTGSNGGGHMMNQQNSSSAGGMSTTSWPSVPQAAQQRQQFYGTLANSLNGQLALEYPHHHHQQQQSQSQTQQQQLPSSLYSNYSDSSLFANTSSASVFDTAEPTAVSVATSAPFGTSVTSLPMSNGGINSHKNATTNGFNNNNNNNGTSAPAEDRYAALKDLDEQLRESKAVAAHAASIVTANVVDSGFGNPNNGTVNPFAAHAAAAAAAANPFQNTNHATPQNATQLFGQMTLIPNGIAAANGFLNAQKAQPNGGGFFNYTANGFTNAAALNANANVHMYPATMPVATAGPNGCGFGFGSMQQQMTATGNGGLTAANTFNNPFAANSALNSNNPFL